ncbi:hypothetical protein F6B41_09600 [Microbacterium lushaniae]|nr:hypothetical protein F6B41_31915 [Microbacterium lushaniae]KAA9155881.1 hypothetical protein F6B41_09600 [Microbacterium lushaniae]
MDDRDLPEGVIDADPPGGWESGAVADGETAEQNRDAQGSPRLSDSGLPADAGGGTAPEGPIESDAPSQVADPDLSDDEES